MNPTLLSVCLQHPASGGVLPYELDNQITCTKPMEMKMRITPFAGAFEDAFRFLRAFTV